MLREWPEIGSQDIKDIKIGLGAIDIPEEDLNSDYANNKWILAEPRFSDEEIIQMSQSCVFNNCYQLFAASGSRLEHRYIPHELDVSHRVEGINGGGFISREKEGITLSGTSNQFGSVPHVVTKHLEKMIRKAWVPDQSFENLDPQSGDTIETNLLVDSTEEPYEFYDGGVNLFWLGYAQVHEAFRKVYEAHLTKLKILEDEYRGVVHARKERIHSKIKT